MARQLRFCEAMELEVLGSPLLTCFSLQGLLWCCHGGSPMGGLEPRRGTSAHVAFQLSHEPLLGVGNEEQLGEEAERGTLLQPEVRQSPILSPCGRAAAERGVTQFPWLVICFWFCGKHGVMGQKCPRYPAEVTLDYRV